MSFKREGDDKGLLDNLRRRRINELLGEDIPEDEAKLLCNGRFACLVCGHNPVFDTVNMLMVHRQGKKHAASDAVFVRKKKELQALVLRRQHEQYMKDGTTNIRQAVATARGGILTSQPYNPCVKKHKAKPYERKARLDLQSALPLSQSIATHGLPNAVPKNHSHQLNIFRRSQARKGPATPYVRQGRTHSDSKDTSCHAPSIQTASSGNQGLLQTSTDSQHSHLLPLATSSSSLDSSFSKPSDASFRQDSGLDESLSYSGSYKASSASLGQKSCSSSACSGETAGPQYSSQNVHSVESSCWLSGSHSAADSSVRMIEKGAAATDALCVSGHSCAVDCPGTDEAGSAHHANLPEKKRLLQKYYEISGSGWKKDWDGRWIRDKEAEFDSDEEPPDLP